MSEEDFVAAVDALVMERGETDAIALFERACARDSVGFESQAEPLYRAALAKGTLDAYRSTRASIQLASTLRLLDRLDESEQILVAELDRHLLQNDPALHDEARAVLALTYLKQGRAAEAAGLALVALAPRLLRYQRSIRHNALPFVSQTWDRQQPNEAESSV
jgi:hypothetical protein